MRKVFSADKYFADIVAMGEDITKYDGAFSNWPLRFDGKEVIDGRIRDENGAPRVWVHPDWISEVPRGGVL